MLQLSQDRSADSELDERGASSARCSSRPCRVDVGLLALPGSFFVSSSAGEVLIGAGVSAVGLMGPGFSAPEMSH